jgi:hypothetical protein
MYFSEFKSTSCTPPLAVSSPSITKFACQCVVLLCIAAFKEKSL